MANKLEIMFTIESEQGIEPKIQQQYSTGWELIAMSYTGDLSKDGFREVALVYKYVN